MYLHVIKHIRFAHYFVDIISKVGTRYISRQNREKRGGRGGRKLPG